MSKALKCVSALLASAVFLSSSVYATEQKMTKDELSVLYYNDGSNVDGIYGEGVRNLFVMNNGAGEHKSYWKYGQSTQILQFLKDIYDGETPTTKWGLAQISFDICAKQKDHFIISEIRDTEGNGIATFFMNGMGKMAFQKGGAWPTATYEPDCARDYETDVWYNIKILFDFRNRKIDYFCDNEFWGSSVISGDIMNSETDAEVSAINFNIMTNYTIKGGIAVQSDGTEEFYIDNLTYGIPRPYDAKINISTQNDGNIFFEKDKIKFDLNIINMTEKDEKYSLKTVVKNDGNKTVWQEAKEIIVNKNSEVYAEVNPIVDKFGFYDAEVILTDKNGNVAATQSTRFSVANRGDEGIVNNKMGVANHFGHNLGDMNVILPIERRLGFAWGRDDVPWAHVVSNSGEVMPATAEAERFDKWTNLAEEKNVNILGILGSGHAGMGIDWPASMENVNNKNGLAKYEEYTEAISKLKPSVEAWELFNEWNINSNTANGGSPEAYAEVLRHGARGVRKGNPNAKIVGFCTALVDTEWIEKVIIALGDNPGQYFDAISVHPYVTTGDKPENGNIDAELENLEHMLVKYGLQDKELWITEIGYSTGAVVNKVTEKLQAEYTIREAAIVEHYADMIDWYTITQKQDTTEAEMGFGALRTYSGIDIPYEARPMALALANYNTLMSDSRYMVKEKPITVDAYDKALKDSFLLATVRYHDGYKNIQDVISVFLDKEISDTKADEIKGTEYKSIDELKEAIGKTAKPITGPGNNSRPGGGSSGGGGIGQIVIDDNAAPQETPTAIPMDIFIDIDDVSWAKEAIINLAQMQVINGKGDGMFCPNDYVTREETAKMISAAFAIEGKEEDVPFDDVDDDMWYADYVKNLYAAKIVNGISDTKFGTGENITRQDMAVICCNTAKYLNKSFEEQADEYLFVDDDFIADYASDSVYALYNSSIISGMGDGRFAPDELLTRAQAAKMIYELYLFVK